MIFPIYQKSNIFNTKFFYIVLICQLCLITNTIAQDNKPIPLNEEIATAGAVGTIGGVSVDVTQIGVFQALLPIESAFHIVGKRRPS